MTNSINKSAQRNNCDRATSGYWLVASSVPQRNLRQFSVLFNVVISALYSGVECILSKFAKFDNKLRGTVDSLRGQEEYGQIVALDNQQWHEIQQR